jgi:LytTr DNA-binding domain
MLKILSQPYPFIEKTRKHSIVQSCLEGVFVALFLNLFQPFGISELQIDNKIFLLSCYGLATCGSNLILRLGIFKAFPIFFSESKWTVLKEIGSIMLLLTLIASANIALTLVLFQTKLNLTFALEMLFMVLVIGIFPTIFGVMLNYIIQLKKYNKSFRIDQNKEDSQNKEPKNMKLMAENGKDSFEINKNDLLYITSSDNYSTIHFVKDAIYQKELIRSSLTKLESQIDDVNVVRTHRSFIANLQMVERVSGNAQGYLLHLKTVEIKIPVARKYVHILDTFK